MSDSCVLNAYGTLKNTDEIQWFNDPDDNIPMNVVAVTPPATAELGIC
jgi:hypothetical protein